jgi:ribonuclease P protein component
MALSKCGRRIQNDHFIAVFEASKRRRSRLGITVTKKVGKAVKRNRIKRCVREFFRQNRHFYPGNWEINIIAKGKAVELSAEQAYRSLEDIFERLSNYDYHQ